MAANCSLRMKLIAYKDTPKSGWAQFSDWDILVYLSCPAGNENIVLVHWQQSTPQMLKRVGSILEDWDPNMPIRVEVR